MGNETRVVIHMSHRIGALVTTSYIGWLKKLAFLVSLALLVQVSLGLSNVYWHLPLAVAVAHNAGGALLLLTLVALNYYSRTARVRGTHLD